MPKGHIVADLMIAYGRTAFATTDNSHPLVYQLPARDIATIQSYLYSTFGLQYDIYRARYVPCHSVISSPFDEYDPDLRTALCALCECFWERYRVLHGSECEPPDYLVKVVEFVERQYFLRFSYCDGRLIDD